MATSGDVSIAQDGGHVKLHPYFVALVRWCVSCVWSAATVLLHRLVTAPLPITVSAKPSGSKNRSVGSSHLHPEPRVECVVLREPDLGDHTCDIIFVHGLYGSLENTWRQGDWRSKYKIEPDRISLRRPSSTPTRTCKTCNDNLNQQQITFNIDEIYKDYNRIPPEDNIYISEKFYNNTLLDQIEIVSNYESQANFVRDLFNSINNCDNDEEYEKFNNLDKQYNNKHPKNYNENNKEEIQKEFQNVNNECKIDTSDVICKCKMNNGYKCEIGCGCDCDNCYSECWPRDWIKVDHPGARVISVNYTSDPYLWRPLWIKECKRLRLHERAEQMTEQLLALGVGKKPIIWVGHSKGGLFIKQIYCEAYEAYLKNDKNTDNYESSDNLTNIKINKEINYNQSYDTKTISSENGETKDKLVNTNGTNNKISENSSKNIKQEQNNNYINIINKKLLNNNLDFDNTSDEDHLCKNIDTAKRKNEMNTKKDILMHLIREDCKEDGAVKQEETEGHDKSTDDSSEQRTQEDQLNRVEGRVDRASLWQNSVGFMFYSVPHRGSPLADIKTPITARSIELLEISKDCALVVALQARWLAAAARARPAVRSLVETGRTLMCVLWLTIVSVHSADAGIGALCGVSVDHREICKPTSRHCLLYTELMNLIAAALNKCRCQ